MKSFLFCLLLFSFAATKSVAQSVTKAMEEAAFKRGKAYANALAGQLSGKSKEETSPALGTAINTQMQTDKIGGAYILIAFPSNNFDLQATLNNIDKENRVIVKSLSTYIVTNYKLVHDVRGRQPELPWPSTLPRPDLFGQQTAAIPQKTSEAFIALINEGNDLLKEKQFEKAIEKYLAATKENADSPTPYYNLGICYNNLKQYDKSAEAYEKAIARYGNLIENKARAHYNVGTVYYSKADYNKSLEHYTESIKLMPDSGTYYRARFYTNCKLGRDADAVSDKATANAKGIEFTASCPAQNNTASDVAMAAAQQLLADKKYTEAALAYTEIIKKAPNNVSAYTNRGVAYFKQNENVKALADFKKAEVLDPYNTSNLINAASVLYIMGKYKEAVVYADKAIAIDPKKSGAYEIKGKSHFLDKQFEAAISAYAFLITDKKYQEDSYTIIAKSHSELGNVKTAIENYTEVLRMNPKNIPVLQARAKLYEAEKRNPEALRDYNAVLALDPKASHIYVKIGAIYQRQIKYDEAMVYHRKALQYNPEEDLAYSNIGLIYFMQLKYKEAKNAFDSALKLNPDYALNHFYQGRTLIELKQNAAAIKYFDQTLIIDPDDNEAIFYKSYAIGNTGDYAAAKDVVSKYILKDQTNKFAYNNRGYYNKMLSMWNEAITDYTSAIKLDRNFVLAYQGRAPVYCFKNLKGLARLDEKKLEELGQKVGTPCQ